MTVFRGRGIAGQGRPAAGSGARMYAGGSPGVSRRDVLRAALVGAGGIALGGSLAACATPTAAGAGRPAVMIWDLFSGGDGALMQEMVAARSEERRVGKGGRARWSP